MAARTVRTGLVGLAAAALTATAFTTPAQADSGRGHRATQEAMDAAVEAGVPGVAGQARDADGVWKGTSGVGDRETGAPRSAHDRYRIGSLTKTFVSTVLLQLQAEGRIDLDDPVDKWLPGVVDGNGHDGTKISVRRLLNHTSGIFNYTSDPDVARKSFTTDFLKHRYDTYTAEQVVDIAMSHEPTFEPGTDWSYSNTNYALAGMVIEKVTGRAYADEIEARIIDPLDLDATTLPGTDPKVPAPSSRAYSKLAPPDDQDAPIHDVTEMNPSVAGAAGAMISDSADVNRFYTSLLRGKLLPERELKEMKTTVPTGEDSPKLEYGLGLMKLGGLTCGTELWGHSGGINGSSTYGVTTENGDHSLAFNFNGDWTGDAGPVIEGEFCGG
ncbi:serine hydrolase domain-containing protein [Streptomyces cavernicola]|uniref:Serine hydrolase domain-containing protein n=1 Tax=Streptomyces cavernicola TaxID=3043613 RepID=A0ABT6S806_9ACTN|nr:serine hydrolase domain-containing protein [Streptomyces sp. B-S-A6]MDI3404238.1 serine hydrolase domain-containing protein [Streptomyces sp. B-S-A6]